jgi:hypothetical protein
LATEEINKLLDHGEPFDVVPGVDATERLGAARFDDRIAPFPGAESINGNASEAGDGPDAVVLTAVLLLAHENPLR